MHSFPLHSTFPMPDVQSLAMVHLGGLALACTNTEKRAQPHKEHSAPPLYEGCVHPATQGSHIARHQCHREVSVWLHSPQSDVFGGLQRPPKASGCGRDMPWYLHTL